MKRGPRYRSKTDVQVPGLEKVGKYYLKIGSPPATFYVQDFTDHPSQGYFSPVNGTIERCWDEVHIDPAVARNRAIRKVINDIRKGQKGPLYNRRRKRRRQKPGTDPDYTGKYVNAEDLRKTHIFRTTRKNHGVVEVTSLPPRVHYPFPLLEKIRLPPKLKMEVDFDVGGPFLHTRAAYHLKPQAVDRYVVPGFITKEYHGGFLPTSFGNFDTLDNPARGTFGIPDPTKDLEMDAFTYGAQAWNKYRPKLEVADLGLFIAEAGDIPEQFGKTAEAFHLAWKALGGHPLHFGPKAVAEHFINHQFGWKPFLRDLQGMLNSMTDGDRFLQQLRCDNDQWVRRRGTVSHTESIDHVEKVGSAQVYPGSLHPEFFVDPFSQGETTTYVENIEHIWFSAKFKYFVPSLLELNDPVARGVNDIHNWIMINGLRVSPSLIWRATPWTWLGDWFTGFGEIVNNFTAIGQDHLVAQYAYVMRARTLRAYNATTLRFRVGVPQIDQRPTKHCLWYKELVSKHRTPASPFGFGTLRSDLTTTQLGILAALGITYAL